jgi:hypothetical protein
MTGQTRQPTPFRALRRPLEEARHGITIEGPTGPSLGFPVPGCLARGRPQLYGRWTSSTQTALDPVDAWFRVFFPR